MPAARVAFTLETEVRGRSLSTVAALLLGLLLSGCGNNAILDPAPLSSFLDLRVENDTGMTVKISDCWLSGCQPGFGDTLAPDSDREEADWLNESGGVAVVAVSRSGFLVGCLRVRYRKGEEHAVAHVSDAGACPR